MSGPQQQWPTAPPAWNPPEKRRRSRWLTVGLPVGVVLAVLVALGVVVVRGFVGGLEPAQEAAEAYADALVDQRWEDAHAMLCAAGAEESTAGELEASYGEPPLTGSDVEAVNVTWSNGRTSGDATVVLESDGGVRERVVLDLVEEDGTWRPCP